MKDLEALRLFLAVAEEAGFSRAARRLGVSAAQATRRIASLEAELGVLLFARSTRHVALTEEGRAFQEHAIRIVATIDAAREAMHAGSARPQGRLRVVSRAAFARRVIVPFLREFRERYPAVTLGLELTDNRLDVLDSGADLGINVGRLEDSRLIARTLAETDSVLVASPDYLRRRGAPVRPVELERHDCVTINAVTGTRTWRFSGSRESTTVHIRAPLAVNDADALIACACSGAGIVMVSDWLAQAEIASGALVRVLGNYQIEPRGTPITALYPSRIYLPQKARAFIDFVAGKCRQLVGVRG